MNKNKIFIGIISTSCLAIIAIGLFFSTGYYNVIAEGITTIINEDSIKEYDLTEQEVTIKDIDKKSLVKIKLLTPIDNKVGLGYQRVAEYEVTSIESLKILVSEMEYYDISDSMKEIERTVDYKIKNIEEVNITDYETICKNITDEETIDKDLINIEENCITKIIGSHLENKTTWLSLDKVNFLRDENIIVGLYTDVQKGDKIEWIPTFQIDDKTEVRIEEWASWTADLNTDLISYYKLDENAANSIVLDSVGTQNGNAEDDGSNINTSVLYDANGIINSGFKFDGTATAAENIDITGLTSTNGTYTFSMWLNPTNFTLAGQFLDFASERLVLQVDATTGNLQLYDGAFKDWTNANAKLTTGLHHYVFIFDSSANTCELYKDNSSLGTVTYTTRNLGGIARLGSNINADIGFAGIMDEVGIWSRALTSTEVTQLYNSGTGISWTDVFTANCIFSGYVKDESGTALVGANVTVWNQFNVSEYYSNTTIADGKWSVQVPNSTNTYMAGAYYNNTLIGQLKQGISGTC